MSRRDTQTRGNVPRIRQGPPSFQRLERNVHPVDRVHPILVRLMDRTNTIPPGEPRTLTETAIANGIYLALELAEPREQARIVSRIMSADEVARQRLQHPEVQNLNHHIILSEDERSVAVTQSPVLDDVDPWGRDEGDCNACGDTATVRLGCDCTYCITCFRRLVRMCLRNVTDFPPRCCGGQISERRVRRAGRPGLVHLYRQREAEANTPAEQRVYCHNCNTFLAPDQRGACPVCGMRTCLRCRGPSHPEGFRCEGGRIVEDVWETMDRNGLVNCPDCGHMIQLWDGCNHMTCRCGMQFCYLCGEEYGYCDCPQYRNEELRLPIARRPGKKPERYRRESVQPTRSERGARIPQLRPEHGEVYERVEWPTRPTHAPGPLPQQQRQERPRMPFQDDDDESDGSDEVMQDQEQARPAHRRRLNPRLDLDAAPPGMEQYFEGRVTPEPARRLRMSRDEYVESLFERDRQTFPQTNLLPLLPDPFQPGILDPMPPFGGSEHAFRWLREQLHRPFPEQLHPPFSELDELLPQRQGERSDRMSTGYSNRGLRPPPGHGDTRPRHSHQHQHRQDQHRAR